MALPPIKINISPEGVDKMMSALKSVEKAVEDHEKKIIKARQDSADKQKKIHQDLLKELGKGATSTHDEALANEKKHTNALAQEYRRRGNLLSSVLRSLGLPGGSASAIGSGYSSMGSSGGSGSLMLAGGVAGAALLAVSVLKKAFDVLESGIEKVVGDFASAILQIGGGFSVSDSIVQAANREKLNNQVRMSALNPLERMGRSELNNFASSMASQAEYGGQSSEDWMKGIGKFTQLTGKQASATGDLSDFLGKLAHTHGMSLEEVYGMAGTIQAQNPSMSNEQTKNLLLRARGISSHGSFNLNEINNMGQLTRNAANIKGDYAENAAQLMGLAALIKPNVGGTVEEASTATNAFMREMKVLGRKGTGKQYGIEFDKQGNLVNLKGAISNIEANYMTKGMAGVPKELQTRESGAFLDAMKTQISGKLKEEGIDPATASLKQIKAAADALQESYSGASSTIEQLNNDNTDSISVMDRLKASFNEIKDNVGDALLPKIKEFAKFLEENGLELSDVLIDLYDIVTDLIPAFVFLAQMVIKAARGYHAMATAQSFNLLNRDKDWVKIGKDLEKLEENVKGWSEPKSEDEKNKRRAAKRFEKYMGMDLEGRDKEKTRIEKDLGIGNELWNPLEEKDMTDKQRRDLALLKLINESIKKPPTPNAPNTDLKEYYESKNYDSVDKSMNYQPKNPWVDVMKNIPFPKADEIGASIASKELKVVIVNMEDFPTDGKKNGGGTNGNPIP